MPPNSAAAVGASVRRIRIAAGATVDEQFGLVGAQGAPAPSIVAA
jgi:hypothetical protein